MESNPFRQKPGFHKKDKQFGVSRNKVDTRGKFNKKEKEWGIQKFTPVVKTQLPTPWSTFKNEIIQKQQEEAKLLNNPNMESEEARQFLKKREQNFRRSEIAEGRKEDIKWEDFSEKAHKKSSEKRKRRKQIKKDQRNKDKSPTSKNSFPVVDEKILNNFDSKQLTSHQNNRIRKMITKTTYLARGAPIESVVNDLKRRGLKPTKKLV
ncbi:uncharacterized protein LOC126755050 [Bactrocera neohumeralis]|uniref:uncharacterized protein LOC126755050 n=1 Tax=Bactrocera neohumeralis TaxID=98809 RepID=UPI0021665712|nr:uncharacterized protein LOC126755050 [Bactrocera neohumeralis]